MKKKAIRKKTPGEMALMLRTCSADMTSHGGFVWPTSGPVECADWKPTKECGNGLHGLLRGEGDGSLLNWSPDAKWLVVEVALADVVDIDGGKVKAPRGSVVYCGDQNGATRMILDRHPSAACVGSSITAGIYGQATAGSYGKATAGNYGQATAGDNGKATAGIYGQATAGIYGQATAGIYGQATAGYNGQATAGNYGQATAGIYGQATAGDNGKATAGIYGQATAGEMGSS